MAVPPPSSSRLQSMLQTAVQSIHWTYTLFWQISPQEGVLVWTDGYYNGAIKTRKTVEPIEVSAEEASLQRSQQLRDLYDTLSCGGGETNGQPARRPYAALSPEDLTESEWFYLMCVSFSFPPGVGLPGKAYARRQHCWLAGANEVDSKTFSRAILAKSARIQTVVCIPLLDGVVEVGTTERIEEDLALVEHIKTFFTDHQNPLPPRPALSEQSTSNAATSLNHPPFFHSSPIPSIYTAADPPTDPQVNDAEDDDDDEDQSDSDAENAPDGHRRQNAQPGSVNMAVEPSELMQLEMSEDIRFGSPEDGSNNLDSDFNLLVGSQIDQQRQVESLRAESARRWPILQDPLLSSTHHLQQLPPGPPLLPLEDLSQEDTHYSVTVSTILQKQSTRWPESSTRGSGYLTYSAQSAFAKWTTQIHNLQNTPPEATSQWLLKYILFSVPFLHKKYRDEISPKSRGGDTTLRKSASQDELSANHVLAERRRREKLNEKFIILRSLVPFVTKMDKASILGDTIEYLKELRNKIQDLETRKMENNQQVRSAGDNSNLEENRSGLTSVMGRALAGGSDVGPGSERRKLRIVEGSGGCAKSKTVDSPPPPVEGVEMAVEVSIIERDALLELQYGYKEGLLLDVMEKLRELGIEATTVQSSLNNGVLVAELRAKVGKKISIMEVKRAIKQIIMLP